MRIVIDVQGMQSESRFRGIGRYIGSLLDALVKLNTDHDIVLIASAAFPQSVIDLRNRYDKDYANCSVVQWHGVFPVAAASKDNKSRAIVSRSLMHAFVNSLQPDVFLCTAIFEGFIDNAMTVIPSQTSRDYLCAAIVYDLIPLRMPENYLTDEQYAAFYKHKLTEAENLDLCLTISEFSKSDIVASNLFNHSSTVNISAGRNAYLKPTVFSKTEKQALLNKYSLKKPYLLCVGGGDIRKNLPRLVKAFVLAGPTITKKFQLLFAGQIHAVEEILEVARTLGGSTSAFKFLSFIPDEDLHALYSCSEAVIAPSLYEGFGLTVLEAMACGVPVICSNTTSLQEVIENPVATFDPLCASDMAARITSVLTDTNYRIALVQSGLERARCFTWEASAAKLLQAFESASAASNRDLSHIKNLTHQESINELIRHVAQTPGLNKWSDASLISLAKSVEQNHPIGSRKRTLFVDVSELSQRDSGTGVQRVTRSLLHHLVKDPPRGYSVKPVYGSIEERGYKYAHRFGNKIFGGHFYPSDDSSIEYEAGDIFLGLDLQHHVIRVQEDFYHQMSQKGVQVWFFVYDLLPIQFPDFWEPQHNVSQIHIEWLKIVSSFHGVLCISTAVSNELKQWLKVSNHTNKLNVKVEWFHLGADYERTRSTVGWPADAEAVISRLGNSPTFLMVGTIEPRKGHTDVLNAAEVLWKEGKEFSLVVVGGRGWLVEELLQRLDKHSQLNKKLFVLNEISDEYLSKLYEHSDCLIAASYGEGFGLPLIEAAQRGLSIVCRDIPVFREVATDYAMYFGGEHTEPLATTMRHWLCAYDAGSHLKSNEMPWLTWEESSNTVKGLLVKHELPRKQLFLDISELAQHDAKTGIQRVVRNLLKEIYLNPPNDFRVQPVYASLGEGYRYANKFVRRFFQTQNQECDVTDEFIDYAPGDIFFGLDLKPDVQVAHAAFFPQLRRSGVVVEFLIFDLLPLEMPQFFVPGSSEMFESWLHLISQSDGAVCISKSTAESLTRWVNENCKSRPSGFQIAWSHIGIDSPSENLLNGRQGGSLETIGLNQSGISFLMVGTLEPRKGHAQVIAAFSDLWSAGIDVQLFIVGKSGWLCDELSQSIAKHPELRRRLFWLDDIDDDDLNRLYLNCTCLIAASYGEGFGLPLIEAAQKKLPIIARDIQVFREVAGDHAFYFEGNSKKELGDALLGWLKLHEKGSHPRSEEIQYLTWAESAKNLLEKIGLYENHID